MSNSDSYEDYEDDILSKKGNRTKADPANDNRSNTHNPEDEAAIQAAMEKRRKYINRQCMEVTKSLDFNSSEIDDLDCITISMYLTERHTNLRIVHLGSNQIGDEGLIDILSGLQYHTSLKELYLGNNPITELGIEALIDTLPLFQNLEILGLSNVGITDELMDPFCDAVAELSKLNTLFLNSNDIGDDGFLALSVLFSSSNLPLRVLHVGDTKPTSQGLVPFLKTLQSYGTLKHLYLNDISLDNEEVGALNKLLVKNQTLEQVNLGNCNINDEGLSLLKKAIMSSNLQYLHLWGNKITDEGAIMLIELIQEHNDTLLGLTLFNNPIKNEEIFDEINELMKQNIGFSKIAVLREKGVFTDNKEEKIEDEYEDDFEDDDDVKDYDEEDKENKATEQRDEEELQEIEKEISDAEREFEQEKIQKRALKEKKQQGKVKEKIWQGFTQKSGGLLQSTFQEK